MDKNLRESVNVTSQKDVIMQKKPINILVTEDDISGNEIPKMTNFIGNFINEGNIFSTLDINNTELSELIYSNSGLMYDATRCLTKNLGNGYGLVLDLDSLPKDVRNKLFKNEYRIADSKQVCGNMRSVIVNEKGVRVKDITLKKANKRLLWQDGIESIYNRIQLKQIYVKLKEIEDMQWYQLHCSRNHRIVSPFLSARDYVKYAQGTEIEEEVNKNLKNAEEILVRVKNEVTQDLTNTIRALVTNKGILGKNINKYIQFISEDLHILGLVYGMLVQVYSHLGKIDYAEIELKNYINELHKFFFKEVEHTGLTAVELVHDNFNYSKNNLDFWFNLQKEMKPKLHKLSLLYVNEPHVALKGGNYAQNKTKTL